MGGDRVIALKWQVSFSCGVNTERLDRCYQRSCIKPNMDPQETLSASLQFVTNLLLWFNH